MASVAKDFKVRQGVTAGGSVTGTQLISTISTGTAPLTVSSTTAVTNLNADMLDGNHASAFATTGGNLSQFAATTSAQLAGVISDETGSDKLVFNTSPTFVTSLVTSSSSFDLFNATATTLNIGGAATTLALGAATGTATIANATVTLSNAATLNINGANPTLASSATGTLTLFNTNLLTVNAFGAATSLTIGGTTTATATFNLATNATASSNTKTVNLGTGGAASSTTNVNIGSSVAGTTTINSPTLVGASATQAVFNTTATTVNAFGAATTLNLGAATGTTTVANSLTVSGNLTVNGTTTTINSTTQTLDDPIFTLGGDTAPGVDDSKDRGLEFRWHTGSAAKVGFFGFDDSTGYFTFIPDATNTSEVFSGTPGDIQATNFRGALVGNADTATKWSNSRTVTFATGDVTGSFSIDGSANVSNVALSIAANSVALGTDTTGDYVATITGTSNQVSVSGAGTEGRAVTLSTPQDIHTAATPTFAAVKYGTVTNSSSQSITVTANATPTTVDSFLVSGFTTAEYVIQMKQGTKVTTTHLSVSWDGTDCNYTEWGIIDGVGGAANATLSAAVSAGTLTVSATSPDAASTNVAIKTLSATIAA